MNHYNHQHEAASAPQQQQEAYHEAQEVAAYVAPRPPSPPIGYPTKDVPSGFHQQAVPVETKPKGEGFWKGCVAALCCCWVLDVCCC
ncbi:protein CYSTEINE-RICH TRANSMEMBRANE MODULE 4-like [Ziziphus jujuba]|uniref:Protein CYSTEINE-RICH TRANSMEMBRANE MODULE 4-like n=1 Tax=Ziziphus jujuba TaxID=326968 RepID=A0ABM3IKF9_ZIZJJ|nr:protein CYSTEINE-RICH TRANSMEMBRANE MODULE 4-like [Ziziphus jujuba]